VIYISSYACVQDRKLVPYRIHWQAEGLQEFTAIRTVQEAQQQQNAQAPGITLLFVNEGDKMSI
jgi:hypothetical protein